MSELKENAKIDYTNRIITLPNILTFIRLGAVPIFVLIFFSYYDYIPYLAGVVFGVISITDIADGFIARKFNMVSSAGKALDPLADKVTYLTALICLVVKGNVHWAFVIVLLVKELYLIIFSALLYNREFTLDAMHIGKVASLVINVSLFLTFFKNMGKSGAIVHLVACITLLIGLVLSIACVVYYTVRAFKQTGGKWPPKKIVK